MQPLPGAAAPPPHSHSQSPSPSQSRYISTTHAPASSSTPLPSQPPQFPPTPPHSSVDSAPTTNLPSSRRKLSLTNISIPSFAAFRAKAPSVPFPTSIRRKPVPNSPPVPPARSASQDRGPPKSTIAERRTVQRCVSLDGPQEHDRRPLAIELTPIPPSPATGESAFAPRDLDRYPHGDTPNTTDARAKFHPRLAPITRAPSPPLPAGVTASTSHTNKRNPNISTPPNRKHTSYLSDDSKPRYSPASDHGNDNRRHSGTGTPTMATFPLRYRAPSPVQVPRSSSPQPTKSPPRRGWFAWNKTVDQAPLSPATTISESPSPKPSPGRLLNKPLPGLLPPSGLSSLRQQEQQERSVSAPLSLDVAKANGAVPLSDYVAPATLKYSTADAYNRHILGLERELRETASELANSIRREMELEDELERFRIENPPVGSNGVVDPSRRTSDYYSDCGASSVRWPVGDGEQKLEEMEKQRRKIEQDKANLKVEMGQRLHAEMQRRKELELQLQSVREQQPQNGPGGNGGGRERELESNLLDVQRRLAEELQFKENFEDLITAMRSELESLRNERDNLKDEVVPQLRARVDGLETEVQSSQRSAYETTKELETLKSARRLQLDMQQQAARFGAAGAGVRSIAEESDPMQGSMSAAPDLARSKSQMRSRSSTLAMSPSFKGPGLQRSSSIKSPIGGPESLQQLSERLKDIEDQRDALHQALKLLLTRQEYQVREHGKRVKALLEERNRALATSPGRSKFHGEVAGLKAEVSLLRRRADDALEQKWHCEKGLSGLRMDLDRAYQETSSLRGILQEHSIPVPVTASTEAAGENQSLDKAYKELRTTHALSLARVLELGNEDPSAAVLSPVSQRTVALLKQSISSAEAERDEAMNAAESYRLQARALQKGEVEHLSKNHNLAQQLYASAERMDGLAGEVQAQLESNRGLRARLADAVARGEREQRISERRILDTQGRLRDLEEQVTKAQTHTEEVVQLHDDEVQRLNDTHREQLGRIKGSVRSPRRFSFLVGVPSPTLSLLGGRTPRLAVDGTSNTAGMGGKEREVLPATVAEKSRSEELEKRVRQLERALKDAEDEMGEVVGRMNLAQIEVAELQGARDEAMMQTRRLQKQILEEREKVKALMG